MAATIQQALESVAGDGLRNIAFFRAMPDPSGKPDIQFWAAVRMNFMCTAILAWCKIYADSEHRKLHWRNCTVEPESFMSDLLHAIGATKSEFDEYTTKTRKVRSMWVAHCDPSVFNSDKHKLPKLDLAVKSLAYIMDREFHGAKSELLPVSSRGAMWEYEKLHDHAREVWLRVFETRG